MSVTKELKFVKPVEPKLSAKQYAERIKTSWHQSVKDILATAKICADADGALLEKGKKELLREIADRMGANEHSMLVQIGGDKRFDDSCVQALNRRSSSALYAIL
jgi:hypothetical protein